MKMYTQVFNSMRDLNDYVNDNGITQNRIVNIFSSDGTFILVYYSE